MKAFSFKPLLVAISIGAAGIFSYALAADVGVTKTNGAATSSQHESRMYLVKNSSGNLIVLRDHELDAPAVIRKMGNVMNVQYRGAKVDVETTIIMRGDHTTVMDRYLPSDDSDA